MTSLVLRSLSSSNSHLYRSSNQNIITMQIKGVALSLALAAVAAAQSGNVAFTSVPTNVEPGQAVTVTYEGNPNEVSIISPEDQ